MPPSQFDNVRVVLAESDVGLRKTLKSCLHGHGFRHVFESTNLEQVGQVVREDAADLLIANTRLPEGDLNTYVKELRHGRHGENPFLVVITLVDRPSLAAVQQAIDSGTDHVLAKPFTPQVLIDQILELTRQRKRFVVTTDYIGPDRRARPRSGTMHIPLIDVPNALRQRMTGQMSEGALRRAIDTAKAKINEQKVERYAYQIGWLIARLVPVLRQPGVEAGADFAENLERLSFVARDMAERICSTRYAHVAGLCLTLSNMVETGLTRGFDPQDVNLLEKMADLIEEAFDPRREDRSEAYTRGRRIDIEDESAVTAGEAGCAQKSG